MSNNRLSEAFTKLLNQSHGIMDDENVEAQIVVMSYLSDAQEEISFGNTKSAQQKINFVKYITLFCGGKLGSYINPHKLWNRFIKSNYSQ